MYGGRETPSMLKKESMKKDSQQILSEIARRETELSKLKLTIDQRFEDRREILEEISKSEERKELADLQIGKLREQIKCCSNTITEIERVYRELADLQVEKLEEQIKSCSNKITGLEREKVNCL